jgi:hypothetical protein
MWTSHFQVARHGPQPGGVWPAPALIIVRTSFKWNAGIPWGFRVPLPTSTPSTTNALTCVRCDYLLKDTAPDAQCPECGNAVRDTLASRNFSGFNHSWLVSARRALSFFVCATVLNMLSGCIGGIYLLSPMVQPPFPIAVFSVATLVISTAIAWCTWRLITDEPAGLHHTALITRWLLITVNLLNIITSVGLLITELHAIPFEVVWGAHILHFLLFDIAYNAVIYLTYSLSRTAGHRWLHRALFWIFLLSCFFDFAYFMVFIVSVIFALNIIVIAPLSNEVVLIFLGVGSLLSSLLALPILAAIACLWLALGRATNLSTDKINTQSA